MRPLLGRLEDWCIQVYIMWLLPDTGCVSFHYWHLPDFCECSNVNNLPYNNKLLENIPCKIHHCVSGALYVVENQLIQVNKFINNISKFILLACDIYISIVRQQDLCLLCMRPWIQSPTSRQKSYFFKIKVKFTQYKINHLCYICLCNPQCVWRSEYNYWGVCSLLLPYRFRELNLDCQTLPAMSLYEKPSHQLKINNKGKHFIVFSSMRLEYISFVVFLPCFLTFSLQSKSGKLIFSYLYVLELALKKFS